LDTQIQTHEHLDDIIKTFDQVQVCHGAMSSSLNDIKSKHQCVESFGMWRHLKCCTILINNNTEQRLIYEQNLNYYHLPIIITWLLLGISVCGADVYIIQLHKKIYEKKIKKSREYFFHQTKKKV